MKTRIARLAPSMILIALSAAACTPGPDFEARSDTSRVSALEADDPGPTVRAAVAELTPASGSEVRGSVRLEALDDGGLSVNASFTGLEPGVHAYHVHQFGDCTRHDAGSAGPHYPFDSPTEMANRKVITGNLGELRADESGEATSSVRLPRAELNGPRSLVGRSVVVHRRGNDPDAPPTGDTGARIACGTIGIVSTLGSETTGSG
jgi:Cu-Zn family superoxide dismutase